LNPWEPVLLSQLLFPGAVEKDTDSSDPQCWPYYEQRNSHSRDTAGEFGHKDVENAIYAKVSHQ
jgi:hypothetical protein